jgi:serine/threonine-protein kinase
LPGTVASGLPFGRLRLLERLSIGGTAEVFLALDPESGERYALKRLLPHAEAEASQVAQLLTEGRLMQRLDHPLIARAFETGEVAGSPYLLLEHVDGIELTALMRAHSGRSAPVELVAAIGHLAGLALDHLHDPARPALQVAHCDVSPQNFMICEAGLKLVDFGIARALHVAEVEPTLRGKHAYLSPERVRLASFDQRSDLFSLGVILWELAAGRRLFRAETPLETLVRVDAAEVPPLSAMPGEIGAILLACLARDPARRPARGREVAEALAPFLSRGSPAPLETAIARVAREYRQLVATRPARQDLERYRASLEAIALGDDPQLSRERTDITLAPSSSELEALWVRLRTDGPHVIETGATTGTAPPPAPHYAPGDA